MTRIVIGIPTFRRPDSLRRLLESIAGLEPVESPVVVLIADNDPLGRSGMQVATEFEASGYRYPLRAMSVGTPGLAAVRNALMSCAFNDLDAMALAMVDDDERVEPGWLVALDRARRAYDAHITFGAIKPEFEVPPPAWAVGLPIYWGNEYPHGPATDAPGTGSILVTRDVYADLGLRFSQEYAFSGGEDRDFFTRLSALGGRFAHASDAISYEYVGIERMSRRWALARAFRVGATDARIARGLSGSRRGYARELSKIPAALAVAALGLALAGVDGSRRMRSALLMWRQAGKVAGLLGHRPRAYSPSANGCPS